MLIRGSLNFDVIYKLSKCFVVFEYYYHLKSHLSLFLLAFVCLHFCLEFAFLCIELVWVFLFFFLSQLKKLPIIHQVLVKLMCRHCNYCEPSKFETK